MYNKKIVLLILLAAAILGAVVLWNKSRLQNGSQVAVQNQIGVKNEAPKGRLISGFPATLEPVGVTTVTDSYSMVYPNYLQYSTVFMTDAAVSTTYNYYLDYLKTNGYTIISQGTDKNLAHIYGTKTSADINVTINTVSGKTQVNIGYLNKGN